MSATTYDLTTGSVWKKLLQFLFPILLGLLFQQLYNTADAFIVGHYLGDDALAAVGGSASVLTNLVLGFFTGLNSGATVIISQRFGSKDYDGLSKLLHSWLVLATFIGAAITVGGCLLARPALELVNNPERIMDDSIAYLRIYITGAIPILVYNLFQGTLQAVGDSRKPLIYLITSCVTNIILDLVFVGMFGWGIPGAGWASVLSMTLCMVLAFVKLLRVDGPHRLYLSRLSCKFGELKEALRIGLPAGAQSMMYSISNTIITTAVNGFGTEVVSAWTATGRLDGFYWVTSTAFSTAISAFVGQCYGAGKIKRMKESIKTCLIMSISSAVMLSTVLLLIAPFVYPQFLHSERVIDFALEIMSYFVPCYFIWSYIDVLSGTFRGAGDAFIPMVIVMLGTCLFRVIWMLAVVPHWHSIMSISLVYGISWVITGAVFTVYYFKGRWLRGSKEKELVNDKA